MDFPKAFPYRLAIPNDERPVDVRSILNFYNSIDFEKARTYMNAFAKKKLTWESRVNKFLEQEF